MKDFGSHQSELLAAILAQTSDFVGTADPAGKPLYVNKAGRRMVGLGDDEDISRFAISEFHPEWAAKTLAEEAIPQAIEHGAWRGESAIRTLDGREIPVSQVVVAHRDQNGRVTHLSTIIRDISDLKAAERSALKASEELANAHHTLTSIIQRAPAVAIQGYNAHSAVTFWNPASERLYGFSESEALGKRLGELIFSEEEATDWEAQARRSMQTGEPLPVQQWETRDKKGETRTILSSSFPLVPRHRDNPSETQLVCMDMDITAHVRAEQELLASVEARRALEEQLVHAQKLESLGRLAGGIAHDFNNLLTVILGYVSLANQSGGAGLDETLQQIREAAERGASLVSQLLAFARRQIHNPRTVSLGELVIRLQQLLRRVLGEDLELVVESEGTVVVSADAGQLEQVLLNMAVNARDAMRNGGTLTIVTRQRVLDAEAARPLEIAPGTYAELVVRDTGSGMTEEVKQRAFEPFFTTKPFGVGTGLGLATCYGIIRQHQGAISVDTRLGQGTEFHILLPLASGKPERERPRDEQQLMARSATVLVVEDEPAVRNVTLRILGRAGVKAIGAASADEARELMQSLGNSLDAVVSDIVMPGTSGPALVSELREQAPELRVLFVTGYSTDALGEIKSDQRTALLQKPFSPDSLVSTLSGLLER